MLQRADGHELYFGQVAAAVALVGGASLLAGPPYFQASCGATYPAKPGSVFNCFPFQIGPAMPKWIVDDPPWCYTESAIPHLQEQDSVQLAMSGENCWRISLISILRAKSR